MIIKKLSASFGVLENRTMELDPGLNIITAPNESGKTTWCAFIRAMLYGVDTSERARGGNLPDKTRYAPWSGTPMQGRMELSCALGDITLTRRTKTASAPMREFSAVYTGTGEPVPGLNGQTAGETLTGVSAQVFDRSAMVRQSQLAVSGSPELEKRIAAIVSSGDEEDSWTEADERLRSWMRRRRFNKYGRLPELEAGIAESEAKLTLLRAAADDAERLASAITAAEGERDDALRALEDSRQAMRRRALDEVAAGKQKQKELEAAVEVETLLTAQRREAAMASPFGQTPPETLEESADRDTQRAAECAAVDWPLKLRKRSLYFGAAALAAFIACMLAGIMLTPWLFIGATVFLAAAGWLAGLYLRTDRRLRAMSAELGDILDKYHADGACDILPAVAEHRQLWQAVREAEASERDARARLEQFREKRDELNTELVRALNFSGGGDDVHAAAALAAAEGRLRAARDEKAMAEGRLRSLGDPMVLETALGALRAEHAALTEQYEAMQLAVTTLAEANAEIQTRFSPALSKLAAGYMLRMTGGRYNELSLDRRFAASARREGDAVTRESAYLSSGAADQLWLALRLAVCELALPEEDACPLVLDDALVNFDPERRAAALELLRELARSRQIILFSCDTYSTNN